MNDIFSFDMDCINDAWLNQYLPDLDFFDSFGAFGQFRRYIREANEHRAVISPIG